MVKLITNSRKYTLIVKARFKVMENVNVMQKEKNKKKLLKKTH